MVSRTSDLPKAECKYCGKTFTRGNRSISFHRVYRCPKKPDDAQQTMNEFE